MNEQERAAKEMEDKYRLLFAKADAVNGAVWLVDQMDRIEAKLDQLLAMQPKSRPQKKVAKQEYTPDFERIWAKYPRRKGSNAKNKAFTAFSARVKGGTAISAIEAGVVAYRAYCEATGQLGTPYVMQAQRFFGPNREWEADWTPPDGAGQPRTEREWADLGRQRGIEARPGEGWSAYIDRVRAAG